MPIPPQARCGGCGHVFPSAAPPGEAVVCPACGRAGVPSGVMRHSAFPAPSVFERNIRRALGLADDEGEP